MYEISSFFHFMEIQIIPGVGCSIHVSQNRLFEFEHVCKCTHTLAHINKYTWREIGAFTLYPYQNKHNFVPLLNSFI